MRKDGKRPQRCVDEASCDLPPQYLRWLDEGYPLRALDVQRDQQHRSDVHERVREVLDDYQRRVTPTLACLGH